MLRTAVKRVVLRFPLAKRVLDQRDSATHTANFLSQRNAQLEAEISNLKSLTEEKNVQLSLEIEALKQQVVPEFSKCVYSHWGEDSIIDFVFRNVANGRYLDIGCYHPALYSNTNLLQKKGWSGVNVDPNPFMISQFDKFRPADKNINAAVGRESGTIGYFNFHDWASSNTASPDFAERVAASDGIQLPEKTPVAVVTLADLMEGHFMDSPPDFMNIDVENLDVDVLKSGDWNKWRPKIVAIEDFAYQAERPKDSEIYRFMNDAGYTMFSRCIYTSFFIEKDYNAKTFSFR